MVLKRLSSQSCVVRRRYIQSILITVNPGTAGTETVSLSYSGISDTDPPVEWDAANDEFDQFENRQTDRPDDSAERAVSSG
jgi:hypothetical protein